MRACVVIAFVLACTVSAVSQQLSSQTKAQAIAEAFTKHKHSVKEKYGVRREKYKDVRSEPLVKPNIREYSGTYEVSGLGYEMTIQVGADGRVEANGNDNGRPFRLENARIEGALLTASKVYENGASERFEGVFLKRTDRDSPTDAGVTTFGLGVMLGTPIQVDGNTFDRLFYQLKS
jgi:hypothetical protein